MKKSSLILVLSFLLATTAIISAQEKNYWSGLKGKYALQFQIADNFQLSGFQGSTFSGKYHFSESSAFRLGVSIGSRDRNEDVTKIEYIGDSLKTKFPGGTESSDKNVTVSFEYMQTVRNFDDISFYYSVGPRISYLKRFYRYDRPYGENEYDSRNQEEYHIGFSAGVGIEWFLKNNLSLSVEYTNSSTYFWGRCDAEECELDYEGLEVIKSKADFDGYSFFNSKVLFGVSFYF